MLLFYTLNYVDKFGVIFKYSYFTMQTYDFKKQKKYNYRQDVRLDGR